jgi:hypothetical protein
MEAEDGTVATGAGILDEHRTVIGVVTDIAVVPTKSCSVVGEPLGVIWKIVPEPLAPPPFPVRP